MENVGVWVAYITGAGLVLLYKFVRYIVGSKKHGKTIGQSLFEWFFEGSADNVSSWLATVGGVWWLGYMFIGEVEVVAKWLTAFPVAAPSAFLLGVLAEKYVPDIIKAITSKLMGALK